MVDRRAIHLKRVAFVGGTSTRVFQDEALGIEIFSSAGKDDCIYEAAFSGMRCKPDYYYRFKTDERALAHRTQWLEGKRSGFAAKQCRMVQRKDAARKAVRSLKVGDVLVASWGWEQTNYDYYQVTRLVGARSVEIRELSQDRQADAGLSMTGNCVPVRDQFVSEPIIKRVDENGRVKVRASGVWASKKDTVCVGGVDVFKPDHYTEYG